MPNKRKHRLSFATFASARAAQRGQRGLLSEVAYKLPSYEGGTSVFRNAPLLALPEWVPQQTTELGIPGEGLQDDTNQFVTTFARAAEGDATWNSVSARYRDEIGSLLPPRPDGGQRYARMSDAIKQIEGPPSHLFVSRPSYALRRVTAGDRMALEFGKGSYFDYIDCGEAIALEFAHECPVSDGAQAITASDERRLRLRQLAGEWHAIADRPSIAGVNCLTVFVDRDAKTAHFPLLIRSSKLGSAMSVNHVIPAGEFQPTTSSLVQFQSQCTLWQTVLREFAEEVLRQDEAKSDRLEMTALAEIRPIRRCLSLIRNRKWKTYFLGVALDPLTLKPEILLVSVIDRSAFIYELSEHLAVEVGFRCLHPENEEGRLLRGDGFLMGETACEATVGMYMNSRQTLPAGRGCLELFWRKSEELLGFIPQ